MVCRNMECPGHTCIHWTSNNLAHLCNSVDNITCRRLQQLPDLWVRCRASESKMEGPNSRPPQSSYHPSSFPPPPAIATDSHQTPTMPIPPPLLPPPLETDPPSPPPPLLPSHTPHSPLPPHTPITPLPHTPLTPHSPLTPLTSQSTLASEASVDSGVASAHSLDLLHNSNCSLDAHALRKRAGSSVSSGTSEVWLGSLDGDPAGLEVLPELWPHSESPSATSASQPPPPSSPQPSRSPSAVSHHSPSSPLHVLPCTLSSPGMVPSPPHQSPPPSCPSPSLQDQQNSPSLPTNATLHSLLPLPSETSVEGLEDNVSPSVTIDMDSVWHISSPREQHHHFHHQRHHLPKEAFSSVIPFHPSALKSHNLGHVWPNSERDGKNEEGEERNVLTDTNALLPNKCLLRSEQSLTNFSSNEALCEHKNCLRNSESLIQDEYNVNCVIMQSKEMCSVNMCNRVAIDRMAREGCVWIDKFASLFVKQILEEALAVSCSLGWSIKCSGQCQREQCREEYQKKESCWWMGAGGGGGKSSSRKSSIPLLGLSCGSPGLCWTPELPYSPSHRPHSRSSLGSSLSFSHDSLISSGPRMDDSHLITGAVSHDALLFPTSKTPHSDVSDIYNVPLDGDIYAVPVDVVKPKEGQILHPKAIMLQPKKRHHRRHAKHSTSSSVYTDGGSKKVSCSSSSHDHAVSSSSKQLKESSSGVSRSRQHSGQSVGSVSGDILRASKRHSVPSNIGCGTSTTPKHGASKENREPIHMTLEEVRKSFHESDDTINCNKNHRIQQESKVIPEQSKICRIIPFTSMKSCKRKENSEGRVEDNRKRGRSISSNIRNTLITIFGLKKGGKSSSPRLKNGSCVEAASQGFAHIVGNGVTTTPTSCSPASGPQQQPPQQNQSASITTMNKNHHNQHNHHTSRHSNGINTGLLSCLGNHRADPDDAVVPVLAPVVNNIPSRSPAIVTNRALPPLPLPSAGEGDEGDGNAAQNGNSSERREEEGCDFASIIEKVKDCGWYWGPISGEAAEKVLANEPDGSFIVRDSSDHHYIFSLTFKLNGFIRHVRIEHDQGNFSFGGFTKFKSQTIVEFIENAVEHSRSGRYLFFLHRRPVLGPMRVQLLHPVSRFKHIQSLQHLCRFVIVKHVRRDLIGELPLPQRLKDYLCSPHYYSERVEQCMAAEAAAAAAAAATSDNEENSASSGGGGVGVIGDEQSVVPSQVLLESSTMGLNLQQEDNNNSSSSSSSSSPLLLLPTPPPPSVLVPAFPPGIPQPVMDRASQTSQAASPNPPNHGYSHFPSHDLPQEENDIEGDRVGDIEKEDNELKEKESRGHDDDEMLPDYNSATIATTVNNSSLPVTLQDAEFNDSSAPSPPSPQSITESSHHHHFHSSGIPTTTNPLRSDSVTTAMANHSPICCSASRVECDIEPSTSSGVVCPRVTLTNSSQAHTASASLPAPVQGNHLAFAHQHFTSGDSGPLSLKSSTSDHHHHHLRHHHSHANDHTEDDHEDDDDGDNDNDDKSSLNRTLHVCCNEDSNSSSVIPLDARRKRRKSRSSRMNHANTEAVKSAEALVGVNTREFFPINPCNRNLEDHVFEDLGGV